MLDKELAIEDLILYLGSFKTFNETAPWPILESSDVSLIHSFCKQICNNVGFTDRQYELAKTKIDDYKNWFDLIDNLEEVKNNITIPLREIDRSRWIKIIDDKIAVRFTFQKKLISTLEDLRCNIQENSDYDKVKKIHYFNYSERTLFDIVEVFKNKNFVLDETVEEIYNKLKLLKVEEHVPGVYNFKIKNLPQAGIDCIVNEIGIPTKDNINLYQDRSIKYGLDIVDQSINDGSLASKIAFRKSPNIKLVSPYTFGDLILAFESLNRLPLLVIVPSTHCYDHIVRIHDHVRNLIPSDEISVVFRLHNTDEGSEFNNYIKREKINNKVDNNTKIVYTLDTKVPKPLLSSPWQPQSIIVSGSSNFVNTRKVLDCFSDVDLVMHTGDEGPGLAKYYNREISKI